MYMFLISNFTIYGLSLTKSEETVLCHSLTDSTQHASGFNKNAIKIFLSNDDTSS